MYFLSLLESWSTIQSPRKLQSWSTVCHLQMESSWLGARRHCWSVRRLEPGCSSESSGVTFLRFKLLKTFFCWMLVQKDNSLVQGKQLSMVLIDLSRILSLTVSLSLSLLFYFYTFWSHNWNNAYQTLTLFSEFFIGLVHETYRNSIFFFLIKF